MNTGLNLSGGKEKRVAQRLESAYLWIALFLAIPVGRLRDLVGTEALVGGYALFVALTAPRRPTRVLLGASVTGEPTAARPGDYLVNTTSILLGSLILIARDGLKGHH